MGDQIRQHLQNISDRAGIVMNELRTMSDSEDLDRVTEHCYGDFDNEDWLSAELEEMGDRFDRLEEAEEMAEE